MSAFVGWLLAHVFTQVSVDPGQEVVELMIPANKVGLIIGERVSLPLPHSLAAMIPFPPTFFIQARGER